MRQSWLALLVAGCGLVCGAAAAFDELPPEDWTVSVSSDRLADGSSIHRYRAVTADISESDVVLSVTFFPRFACEPVVAMSVPLAPETLIAENSSLPVFVDDRSVEWPVTIDVRDGRVLMTMSSGISGQQDLLDRLARGDRARLRLADGKDVRFSLLGSRRTMADARDRCLAHQPEEWVPSTTG